MPDQIEGTERAQAQFVNFALHTLGWQAFQDLCGTIGAEVLGQTFQIFLPSKDAGRDGAFKGMWKPQDGSTLSGTFVAQCKHTSKADATLHVKDLRDELEKSQKLARAGLATNYLLFTNLGISGDTDRELTEKFCSIPGIKSFHAFGRDWISGKIREHPRLRMLVPRIYGLGDLSQILDERQYTQAAEILNSMRHDLATFVITDAHRRAALALLNYNFVLLLGEPASGKSTIAATLAIGAIDNWKCSAIKVSTAEQFKLHWNPHESSQLFWVDDVFGPTQYLATRVHAWNDMFPELNAALRKGAKVVFTSRDYIYRAAINDLKLPAFPLIAESQVVINVQELGLFEKQRILYNHIRLGDQPKEFRTHVKPFLPEVAASTHFLPETAKRLGNRLFTRNLTLSRNAITEFVKKPEAFLVDVLTNLDSNCKAAIAVLFMGGGYQDSPLGITPEVNRAIELLSATPAGVRDALGFLEGSLVKLTSVEGNRRWVYRHPTVGDAFATLVARNPELLDIYLAGTSIDKMIDEVVCGVSDIEGASVTVPKSRYITFAGMLHGERKETRFPFLASRCDKSFLQIYIERHPIIWNELSSFRVLRPSCEIALAARLQQVELLPPIVKSNIADAIVELAASTPDSDFINEKRMYGLFSSEETKQLYGRVMDGMLPDLKDLVRGWERAYDGSNQPDDYFLPIIDVLQDFSNYSDEPSVAAALSKAIEGLEQSMQDAEEGRPQEPEPDEYEYPDYERSSHPTSNRDIFDDVDAD